MSGCANCGWSKESHGRKNKMTRCDWFTLVERGGNGYSGQKPAGDVQQAIQHPSAPLDNSPNLSCGCRYQCDKSCRDIYSATDEDWSGDRRWANGD